MSLFNYDNISWNLPVMFCHDEIIFAISDILKSFGDIKKPVMYAYGAMTSPWSGGRCTNVKLYDKNFMDKHLSKIINSGFIPTFTFTKPVVKEEDLKDPMTNWVLDWGVDHNCEFIVSDDKLYNHIKERHPDAKLVASILQGKMEFHNPKKKLEHDYDFEINFYNDKIDKYDRVVIRPEFNLEKLEKNLDRIKDKNKLEILLNETCVPHCPFAVRCYSGMDRYLTDGTRFRSQCGREEFSRRTNLRREMSFTLMVKKPQLDHWINDCGLKHFKIQGRHYPPGYLFNLVLYYLFEETGAFQSIYPLIIDVAKKYKLEEFCIPEEQNLVVTQMMKKEFIDYL